MLARSARIGGEGASRHAARRLGSALAGSDSRACIGRAPSLLNSSCFRLLGKRTLDDAARCSSTLAGQTLVSCHRGGGAPAAAPVPSCAVNRYSREIHSPLLSSMGANLHLHRHYYQQSALQRMRPYHSLAPSSSLIVPSVTSRYGLRNVTDIEPSFERTMQNIMLRALFSSNSSPQMQPSSTMADTAEEEKKKEKEEKPPLIQTSAATSAHSPADVVTEKKRPKAPKEMAVYHATATDAFISFAKSIPEKAKDLIMAAARTLASILAKTPGVMWYYLTHPLEFRDKLVELKDAAKKEAHHYWMGSKLLAADLRTARQMLKRSLQGTPLTRRERKQLLRTVSDVFRLVPMSIFVLIPFMEFALPFALRIFPNMLPSTFQDSLKAEENMKRELKMRLNMAEFFQETLQDLAQEQKKRAANKLESIEDGDSVHKKKEKTAQAFLAFLEKARNGEMLPAEGIIKYASYFQDELTLDNMPRMQLVNFCRYMSIPPYGSDNVLRFQLRHKMRLLQEDDQRILWEGIDSLTKMELREACQERGMRSTGLSKDAYKRALQQWLELSVNRNVPISLLIMSRTFFLQDEMASHTMPATVESKSVAGLADAISGLDKDVVNEVVLSVASSEEKSSDPDVVKIKLEVLEHQNELIEEEKKLREAIAAKKAAMEQEKVKAEEEKAKVSPEDSDQALATETGTSDMSAETLKAEVETAEADIEEKGTEPLHVKVKVEAPAGHTKFGGDELKEAELSESSAESVKSKEEEEEKGLSTEEIDAISQLVSPSPVSSEREELERIKAAMLEDEGEAAAEALKVMKEAEEKLDRIDEEDVKVWVEPPGPEAAPEGPVSVEEADAKIAEIIEKMDIAVDAEAEAANKMSMDGKTSDEEVGHEKPEADESSSGDEKLDKAVDRLKYRVESMVGRLEAQLTDVEAKIGDKLHLLDKDLDETISTEEMSEVLQRVLKRKLSAEDAIAIASDMDADSDGFLTVAELSRWVEQNKIMKLVEEERDGELDRMIERRREKLRQQIQEAE